MNKVESPPIETVIITARGFVQHDPLRARDGLPMRMKDAPDIKLIHAPLSEHVRKAARIGFRFLRLSFAR